MRSIEPPPVAEAAAFLDSVALFRSLDAATREKIAPRLDWLLLPGGHTVCQEGDDNDGLYLVARGRLAVLRKLADGDEVVLSHAARGDSVGEMAALTGNPRSATLRALRDTVLAHLGRAALDELLEEHPGLVRALTRRLASWISPEPARQEGGGGCVAVALVAAQESLPLGEIAARLAAALSALGPTLHLSADRIDSRLDPSHLASWLDEQEAHHAFLVYEADLQPSAWTRRCLRQVDRILVVADPDAEPSLGALGIELAAFEGRPREELVLHHSRPRERPNGTAGWLALRDFVRHHHIRATEPKDFERLARFVDGTPVGLVLGGGGARGFAHIGVIRALEEAGIPIDRIGGTSMGAVIAGLYARGFDWKHMVRLNRWGWVKYKPHKVYTLPLISLLSTRKAERMLDLMFGDDQIEDLWLSFFCVSTNLTRAEVRIHRGGDLERWVGASMRIPGVVPPMVVDGELLVDGGVLDNLPIDAMRRMGRGPIIAVDVSATVDLRADPSYREAPSPWQFLLDRYRQPPRTFPSILQLIHRSAVLASDVYAKQSKREVELYLDLPLDHFDMFNVDPIDEIVEVGYRYASEQLKLRPWKPAPPGRTSFAG